MRVADVNADGHLDVINVTRRSGRFIDTYLVLEPVTLPSQVQRESTVGHTEFVLGKFNNDGFLDWQFRTQQH